MSTRAEVSSFTKFTRRLITKKWQQSYPVEITSGREYLQRADQLVGEGYGIIYMGNHFSLGDVQRLYQILMEIHPLWSRLFCGPMAYVHRSFINGLASRYLAGIETYPVVTPEYFKDFRKKYIVAERRQATIDANKMYQRYLSAAAKVVSWGGVLGLSPQATRMSELGKPKHQVVESILKAICEFSDGSLPQVFLWSIGLGIPGVKSYQRDEVGGKNKGVLYEARIGEPLTLQEFKQRQQEQQLSPDELVFAELAKLVPATYLSG